MYDGVPTTGDRTSSASHSSATARTFAKWRVILSTTVRFCRYHRSRTMNVSLPCTSMGTTSPTATGGSPVRFRMSLTLSASFAVKAVGGANCIEFGNPASIAFKFPFHRKAGCPLIMHGSAKFRRNLFRVGKTSSPSRARSSSGSRKWLSRRSRSPTSSSSGKTFGPTSTTAELNRSPSRE